MELSRIFGVTADVLLKDELLVDGVKEKTTCGNLLSNKEEGVYEGMLIKESIDNEDILDSINKIEIWKTESTPCYWTVINFSSNVINLPEKLSKVMIHDNSKGGNWFMDFKKNNVKYIVFRDMILKYTIGDIKEKNNVMKMCRKQGIPDCQMK